MKNMTLPAKSCSILLCALLLLAAGCKKDEPTAPESLYGNVENPTWTVPSDYDYTSSMTAVTKVASLNGQAVKDSIVNSSDLLAAFYGETCLGVASPQDGLFFLYVAQPIANSQELTANITLRYYSAHYKNIFEARDAFVFHNDDRLGTIAQPLTPPFKVVK